MNSRAHSNYLAWLYLLVFVLLVSCNDNPVINKIQTQNTLFTKVSISPQDIYLKKTSSSDTTVTVNLAAVVEDSSLLDGNPHYTVKEVQSNDSTRDGSLSTYDSSTKTYSGSFTLQLNIVDNMEFQVTVYGVDHNGKITNSYTGIVDVNGLSGKPPVILFASNPDTVHIPSSETIAFDFKAKVTDPDGQGNIDFVKLDLQKDGSTSKSTFQLYDDGNPAGPNGSNSGDAVAGDSVYTRRFRIDSNTSPNSFSIKYYSFDKNGLGSDTVTTHFVISK